MEGSEVRRGCNQMLYLSGYCWEKKILGERIQIEILYNLGQREDVGLN